MSPHVAAAPASPESVREADERQRLLDGLTQVLAREAKAASELREALIRQRAGVAADSSGAVHASCDDIARVLVALDASRRHRATLLAALVPGPAPTLVALTERLGGTLPPALADAAQALRAAAKSAAQEAGINRTVLQRTVEAGEAFLQALFSGTGDADAFYHAGDRREDGAGFLLDRRA